MKWLPKNKNAQEKIGYNMYRNKNQDKSFESHERSQTGQEGNISDGGGLVGVRHARRVR